MVLPGLIDMHTHLVDQEQTENIAEPLLTTAAYQAYIGAAHARKTLMAGFTSVRDVGTWRAFGDVALRDAIDAGLVPGPACRWPAPTSPSPAAAARSPASPPT
jgi:imidazolonepropionase-like amidohydrolase